MELIASVCPESVAMCFPVRTSDSHTAGVLTLKMPTASVSPSGEYAMADIDRVCPESVVLCFLVVAFHNRIVSSALAVAIILPSGEYTTEWT